MASDSPGTYLHSHHMDDSSECQVIAGFISCANGSRGSLQMGVAGGLQRDVSFVAKDSGYYVSTSDGASTCSSSTTETGESEGGTLLVLEPKSLRSFTTNDEYLYAMKEDLADWFACLYQKDDITADNFFQFLETGVLLCKHANKVQEFARQRREMGETLEMRSYFIRSVPEGNVAYREGVKPETFQARDNVSNFISWGRQLGIPEVLSFETDDLVLRKNEKSVILCLLEIARIGAKLGMLAPTLIQMEQEIDAELAGEEPQPQIQIKTCDMRSLDERVRDLIGRCTCPVQFPMIKVGEGKYKIGDTRSLIFVRILRNHVMVRVGGGWDTLENYLNKHDPCQCNYRGHRPSGVAHKVVVSQQRQASAPGTNVSRTTPNTPTSPRRGSTTPAAANRSTSPQSSAGAKTPALVISRHMPTVQKATTSSGNSSKGGRVTPSQKEQGMGSEACSSQFPTTQPVRCKSPSPVRNRSSSPGTGSHSIFQPTAVHQASSSSSLVSRSGHGHAISRSKKGTTEDLCRSTSFDKQTEMHSRPGLDVADSSNGRSGGTSLSMDKISTMTLADFKSLLSSSLSINEEQNSPSPGSDAALKGRRASVQNSRGEVYMDTASSSLGLGRLAGIGSQPQSPDDASEDSLSTFGSNRPKTPKVLRRSSEALITAETSQPKLPTALSRPKTPKMFSDQERSTSKEEYKMARPKPVSQIKSEASAKVAGAISNLVQAKQDVGATDYNKPKIPARPQTLVGPGGNQSQKLQQENFEDFADPDPSTAITSTARERPVTPSRIPKPSFIPRPTTPKMQSSLAAELSRELSSPVNLLPQQCSTSNLTKLNIMSINRPPGLSRSSSNSSSVKSMDETPVSPASSFSEDRPFKSYSRHRRLSNSSDGFSANSGNANSSCNNSSRSYKDIYTAKKAALSGSENRHPPPTRAVTPGPREKWTLGGHSVESAGHSSNHRRRSINTNCLVDKHTMQKPNIATTQTRRSSNTSNTEADQQMVITNEITFSDDEEINELIKTAAFNAATSNTRSLSVDVSKNTQRKMKGGDEVLMITRQKGDSANKFNVIRRTESRGSSKDRASPALKTFRSITPNSAMFQHKISSVVKGKESVDVNSGMSISQPNNKGLTRTEAWVDSTVPDSKRKPLPRPRRKTGIGNEISVSELASRPLEEIQAILAEPKNGFVHVDSKSLDAPPEDPEMFRKMEKLFEKYREMELKASSNDTSSSSAGKSASVKSSDAVAFGKCENKVLGSGVARPSTSLKLLKSSSGSFMSTSVHSPGSLNDCPVGGRIPSNENSRLTGISMGPIHNQQQRFSSNSSSMIESPQEFLDMGSSSHSEAFSQGLQTSSDQKRLEALQDIDSEVAKNPAALIFKIKEILKVRPRKDENTKVPTRIPAPAVLNKYSRSKSVSNLFSDDLSSSNTCSSHEFLVAQAGSKNVLNSVNLDPSNDDQSKSNTRISAVISSHSSESTNRGDPADEVPKLTRTWSVQSDSSDSQNRSETPAPKLATPLTTGRSTLISRRGEKLGRGLSQEKENNLSNSQTANLSALSTAEDGSEFV